MIEWLGLDLVEVVDVVLMTKRTLLHLLLKTIEFPLPQKLEFHLLFLPQRIKISCLNWLPI